MPRRQSKTSLWLIVSLAAAVGLLWGGLIADVTCWYLHGHFLFGILK